VESGTTGRHHFLLKNAGYAKLYLDGRLVVDKWRQAWNPGPSVVALDMVKGRKYSIWLEWDPDGGESYLGLQWLSPLVGPAQNEYAFRSEVGYDLNYYFVQGTPDEVISGYRTLTGPAPVVPRWALGFWQSRERYKTQAELLAAAAEFRQRRIPIDNIVLDWSYWQPGVRPGALPRCRGHDQGAARAGPPALHDFGVAEILRRRVNVQGV